MWNLKTHKKIFMGFSGSSAGKESTCNSGDPGSITGSGRSPEKEINYPLQHSLTSLVVHLVKNPAETWVWSLGWKGPLEKEMATHSNSLVWRIPDCKSWTRPSEFHFKPRSSLKSRNSHRCRKQTYDYQEVSGGRRANWELRTERYILLYVE